MEGLQQYESGSGSNGSLWLDQQRAVVPSLEVVRPTGEGRGSAEQGKGAPQERQPPGQEGKAEGEEGGEGGGGEEEEEEDVWWEQQRQQGRAMTARERQTPRRSHSGERRAGGRSSGLSGFSSADVPPLSSTPGAGVGADAVGAFSSRRSRQPLSSRARPSTSLAAYNSSSPPLGSMTERRASPLLPLEGRGGEDINSKSSITAASSRSRGSTGTPLLSTRRGEQSAVRSRAPLEVSLFPFVFLSLAPRESGCFLDQQKMTRK